MSLGDASRHHGDETRDQLQHDLKTPLTTISARAQLVARMVRRASALTELERGAMLDSLGAINAAVAAMVVTIDGIGREGGESGGEAEERP
jgi:signal transduction histidine kinase